MSKQNSVGLDEIEGKLDEECVGEVEGVDFVGKLDGLKELEGEADFVGVLDGLGELVGGRETLPPSQ